MGITTHEFTSFCFPLSPSFFFLIKKKLYFLNALAHVSILFIPASGRGWTENWLVLIVQENWVRVTLQHNELWKKLTERWVLWDLRQQQLLHVLLESFSIRGGREWKRQLHIFHTYAHFNCQNRSGQEICNPTKIPLDGGKVDLGRMFSLRTLAV